MNAEDAAVAIDLWRFKILIIISIGGVYKNAAKCDN